MTAEEKAIAMVMVIVGAFFALFTVAAIGTVYLLLTAKY